MLIACLLFLAGAAAVSAAAAGPALRRASAARAFADARQGLYAVSAAAEDVAYRHMRGFAVGASEAVTVGGIAASATVTDVSGGKEVVAKALGARFARASTLRLLEGEGAAFHYGAQAGAGGIVLENSSSIAGNVYANGPIDGAGGNLIKGDVVSAGPLGLVRDVHATSSVYAHAIQDAEIDGDAHYQTLTGTTISGALYPGSTDKETKDLPITDAQIESWKSDAAAGGTIASPCPYNIDDDTTLGPKKINCNMKISGSPTVTLMGPLWVAGDLEIENSAVVRIDASLSGKSIAVIADGKITLQNTASFAGAGANSHILLISGKESGDGIIAKNSVTGALLLYAPESEISLEDSVHIKEVSGYKIRLKNSAEVAYETGLASLLFTAGPSGGYTLGGWKEIIAP